MIFLILGVALWWGAHLAKRLAPGFRANLQEQMGNGSKGVFALAILLSVVLMVLGYRGYTGEFYWGRTPATTGINNLLMVVSVILFGLGDSKSRFRGALRHPMLTGLIVWACAHLLVNGDPASFILFGGLGLWAVVEMIVINRAVPDYTPKEPGTVAGDIRLLVIAAVIYAVIAGIHIWLGYNPFGA